MVVRLLGPVEVEVDGSHKRLRRAERALIARLALTPGRVVSADSLINDLWSEESEATDPRRALRVTASRMRAALGEGAGAVGGVAGGYRLEKACRVDVDEFERRAASGRVTMRSDPATAALQLREALALWRGDPFADTGDLPFFSRQRVRLEEDRLSVLEDLVTAELAAGRHAEVVGQVEDLVRQHPLREGLVERLMVALYRCGRQTDALRAYEKLRQNLADVGLDPGPAVRAAERAVLDHHPDLAAAVAPPAPRLPLPVTSFVGRGTDQASLITALAQSRVVSLVGPAGAGKTRLATETLARWPEELAEDVILVDLAALDRPALVDGAVARAVGADPRADADLDAALQAVRGRKVLILLDNCEHVLARAADAVRRLVAEPTVRVVATSRRRLGVEGEVACRVEPLAQQDAVTLFSDRSLGATLDADQLRQLRQVCDMVDRLPLAIELAAGLTSVLTVAQIAERLTRPLQLLARAPAGAARRHRTLRAALESSWSLLADDDLAVARRLSVFAGTWSLEAAESVVTAPPVSQVDVAAAIARLADASLVDVVHSGSARRFRLLGVVRQLAAEQLEAAAEVDQATSRLVGWCQSVVDNADVYGSDQAAAGALLRTEHDNVRHAIESAISTANAEAAAALATSVFPYWIQWGHYREGRRVLSVVGREPRAPTEHRATALAYAGLMALQSADLPAAEELLETGLTLSRQAATPLAVAQNLYHLGFVQLFRGWPDHARARFEETFALTQQLNRTRSVSAAHDALGQAAVAAGDVAAAQEHFAASLALIRDVDDVDGVVRTLSNQVSFLALSGVPDQALNLLAEGEELAATAGAEPNRAEMARARGLVAWASGRPEDALAAFGQAATLFESIAARIDIATMDLLTGWAHLARGDAHAAEVCAQRAISSLESFGAQRWVVEAMDLQGTAAHAAGHDDEAGATLAAADRLRQERGMHRFGLMAWAVDQARTRQYGGAVTDV